MSQLPIVFKCTKCNRQIGALGDTLKALEKVVKYLRRNNE